MSTNSSTKPLPSHYVGIGASAGGLEALQDMFSYMPKDTGAVFIVVQHLSPDFKSMMPELLSKHTEMPIHSASDGLDMEADTIYLMPPRTNMLISDGQLRLAENTNDGQLHLPIDIFLCSLAEDKRHRAIGVVLSGTGSDGTRGIKALKEMGGLVMVQEPSTAKFDGMPISAYNTGLADMLLPPKEMGANLVKFINHPFVTGDKPSLKTSLSENVDLLSDIFQLLKQQSSINFSQYKASTVARRIERRMGINQLTSLESYMRLLNESAREVQVLNKELLIGVTRFFRDSDAFSKVTEEVIPDVVASAKEKGEGIRLWVAGCSSGEEAYSLAMLLDEEMRKQTYACQVKIFATDVDEDAIAFASAGIYSSNITQEVSPERLDRYFNVQGDQYTVTKDLRQMVIFATHNMIEDAPFSNINMVTCRNVLIYFQHSAQKKVISSLYFALKKEGFLFLGSSESLGDLQSHFKNYDEHLKIYRKASNIRVPIGNASPLRDSVAPTQFDAMMSSIVSPMRASRPVSKSPLVKVHERIIREYAPDCIVLNDMFEAIHVYGNVSLYTRGVQEGRISNNVRDMVVEDLSIAITTALHRCEKTEQDVFYEDVVINTSQSEVMLIDLSIFIVKESDLSSAPYYYVVQFLPQTEDKNEKGEIKKITFDPGEQTRQRIQDLEQELIKKQEHLQITVEELETTNEELQSANEELMSANEELQSTNEELQSVNEELYTVNSEYQEKIFELSETNDDLDGVINSTDIGIIFLDKDMTIRKYTPMAIDYFNVRDQDLGRPFHHVSHTLIYDDMLTDIGDVDATGKALQKEVMSKQGSVLMLKIIPYVSVNKKDQVGTLITVTNVSRLRFVEDALHIAQEQIRSTLLKNTHNLQGRIYSNRNLKLLLLDDSEGDRQLIKDLLTSIPDRKISIVESSSVDEAISLSKKYSFDLHLVDYDLGDKTAKDFVEKIRMLGSSLPTVVLSGYAEEGLDLEFLNKDVVDFLNKNTLTEPLLSRSIDYALERRKIHQSLEEIGHA